MGSSEQHRQVVQRLPDANAVDSTAIEKVIAEVGPSLAVSGFDGPDAPAPLEYVSIRELPFGFSIVHLPSGTTTAAC